MADSESTTAARREPRHKPKTHFDQRATAATVEEAAVRARTIEHAARLQLLAMAAGTIRELPPALGRQAHSAVNIHRALSLVPAEVVGFFDLDTAHHLPDAVLRDYGTEYRALTHAQIEFLAARVSAINQCFY